MAKQVVGIGDTGAELVSKLANNYDELYADKNNKADSTVTGENSTDLAGNGNEISDDNAIAYGEDNIVEEWVDRGIWNQYQFAGGLRNRVYGSCGVGLGVGSFVDGIYGSALGNNNICSGNDSVAMGGLCVTGRRKFVPTSHGADELHGLGIGVKAFVVIDVVEGDVTPIFPNEIVYDPAIPGSLVFALHPYCILRTGETSGTAYVILKSEYSAITGTKVWFDNDTDLGDDYEIMSSYAPGHPEGFGGGNSMIALGKETNAIGAGAMAEGYKTYANGSGAHAEGKQTKATNNYAHAEGYQSLASGEGAHAEGERTEATGEDSHAEGKNNIASGNYSHAEGWGNEVTGQYGHTEGYENESSGYGSHSEGNLTTASGQDSHAEGKGCVASGNYSHAEGYESVASLPAQHAQGASDGKFIVAGDAQYTKQVVKKSCAAAGWHDLQLLTVKYSKSYAAETLLIGRQFSVTNGMLGESCAYKYKWFCSRGAKTDFATTDVDIDNDRITVAEKITSGTPLLFETTDTIPAGLNVSYVFYALYIDDTHIQVEATLGGGAVDITSVGIGTHSYSTFRFASLTKELIGRSFIDDGDTVGDGLTTGIRADLHTTYFNAGKVRIRIDGIATRDLRFVATTQFSEVM